jgi:predicted RNA polymerase sigma factor
LRGRIAEVGTVATLLVAARNRAISKLRRKTGKNEELDENGADLRVNVESSAAQRQNSSL